MNDWHIVKFNYFEIQKVKEERKDRDTYLKDNIFESEQRWIGDLGELGFKDYLDRTDWPYTYWNNVVKNIRDFTLGRLEIDVKTVSTRYFPKLHYACEVTVNQLSNTMVNAYVFARYLLDDDKLVVMGWLPKDEFLEKAVLRKKGERLENNMVVTENMMEVMISELRPLEELGRFR